MRKLERESGVIEACRYEALKMYLKKLVLTGLELCFSEIRITGVLQHSHVKNLPRPTQSQLL